MKVFAVLSFLSLASVASIGNAANLRSNDTANIVVAPSASARSLETKVKLEGVNGEPSSIDLNILGRALVSSYNDLHWEAGRYLSTGHSAELVGQSCSGCPDDDMTPGLDFAVNTKIDNTNMDKNTGNRALSVVIRKEGRESTPEEVLGMLEEALCNKLRNSGSSYFGAARECSLELVWHE